MKGHSERFIEADEILPSKIDAKMNNGILQIQLPKKNPTKAEEEATKVEIK